MTALATSGMPTRQPRNSDGLMYQDILVATGVTVYPGSLCAVVAATGLLTPCAASTTLRFAGMAIGNLGDFQPVTGDGTLTCRVWTRNVEVLVPCAGTITAASMFTTCWCTDDNLVTTTQSGAGPSPGLVVELETSTTCWVQLGAFAALLGT